MRAYLSSMLRITEFTLKNEGNLRFYSRWVHRKPKRILTENEFESSHSIQNMAQDNIEPNVIELDRLEVEREIKSHRKNYKPRNIFQMPENNAMNNIHGDNNLNNSEFSDLKLLKKNSKSRDSSQYKKMENNRHKNVSDNQNETKFNRFDNRERKTNKSNKYNESKTQKYLFDINDIDNKTHFEDKDPKMKNQNIEVKKETKYTKNDILDVTFDEEGNYVYNKMKDNDSRIGSLMLSVKSRKLRERKESVLLEGKRLIRDALQVGCKIEHLLFSRKPDIDYIKDLLPEKGVKLYKMAYKDMQMWSDLTTTPGIMAIFKTPEVEKIKIKENALPLTIICDNIREPGNLGSILRASVAVGCQNLILTKGCVDLWEPKVLRSASGAHFRLNIQKDIAWEQIATHLVNDTSIFLADNKIITSTPNNKNANEYLEHLCTNVPLLPYFAVNFHEFNSLTLIIGGETHGLSEEAYNLALDKHGIRLNIPLDNNIESLNTGTALGVIVFEIKRQFLTNKKE